MAPALIGNGYISTKDIGTMKLLYGGLTGPTKATRMHLRSDSIAWNAVGDNVVVLDLTSATYFSTNATGTLLWHMLASGAEHPELVNALVEQFDVDQETAAQDVDSFLAGLERAKLLVTDA